MVRLCAERGTEGMARRAGERRAGWSPEARAGEAVSEDRAIRDRLRKPMTTAADLEAEGREGTRANNRLLYTRRRRS